MTRADTSAYNQPPGNLTLSQLSHLMESLGAMEDDPQLQLVELQADEVLFRQGDEAHSMYVLVAGLLEVRLTHHDGTESVIDRLQPGTIVGEMALLSGQHRSATVVAVNGASLICLSRAQAERLSKSDAEAKMALAAVAAPRWQRIQLAQALQGLFGDLQPNTLLAVQQELEWLHFSNGDVVFRQGDPPDGLYIVVNGRLRFQATAPDGQATASGEVKAGEMVGEFALLTEEPRSATVFATRETNVARMTQATFEWLAPRYPDLMMNISRMIVERSRKGQTPAKPVALSRLSVALLPASPEVNAWPFAQALCTSLAAYGSTLALTCVLFDERYGQAGASQLDPDDPAHPAIVAWMDKLEAETDFLIFVADPEPSAWTRRCIGQADRVLILADPRGDPTPGAAERLLQEMQIPVRSELVLWHPPETEMPQGTLAWLEERQLHAHHHIRLDDEKHMERLARRLTGRAIALVLGGGAARAFAHLGVHKALEEQDIPVDFLGGTSMGAVMAGSFLISSSNAELMDMAPAFANSKALFDYTLPLTALMASNKVTRFCQSLYGDLQIEDAWLPSFFVATNLSTAEPVIYRQGPLWRAIRSSLAIPGVFTPVMENDEVLVDGGVMENFPVSIMAELSESAHIIGVSVAPYRVKKRQYDYETGISGWRVLFSRLNPFTKSLRAPSIANTILRSLEINSVRFSRAQQEQLDLFLHPEPRGYGLLDFDKYKSITQIGYEATLEPLREWKQTRFHA